MIGLEQLAGWTPVALRIEPEPSIDWADLSGERFAEPFFDQTVARLADRPRVRTGLDALLELDSAPSLEPCGIILHLSRCGSTLASRLLSTMPGVVVVSEPAPVNALLQADPARVDPAVQARVLRLLVRALGRVRFGDERHLVLKLSSWNVRRAEIIRAAFPETPIAWIQRRPAEVVASLLAGRPGWLRLDAAPDLADRLFEIPVSEATMVDPATLAARALGTMLESAETVAPRVIDYRDLPESVWRRLAPHFGLAPAEADIARMRDEARYSAKEPGHIDFAPGSGDRAVTAEINGLAAAWADSAYARLDAARIVEEACSS